MQAAGQRVPVVGHAALVAGEDGHCVFAAEGDTARRIPVQPGPRQGEARIVQTPLGPGPVEIVVENAPLLFDGAPLRRLTQR